MRLLLLPSLLALGALCLPAALGDDTPPKPGGAAPGHSAHGEAFNEGPRQKAVLMEGTGAVHFPVTTNREEAQRFFDQGVGQLHGFWHFEAERSFRQVAALDPHCAMAYWGMAMANANNAKRAAEFIKAAVARQGEASRREQLWIGSLADYYADEKKPERERRLAQVRALEKLSFEFPDDLEAKAFLVLRIWENADFGLPIVSRQAVEALAQQVLAVNPRHPAHHYLIHLWNGEDDRRALPSAALCGQSAPAIAHMWHMPGHTFTKLHRYADAAWQQEAAARVDHAHMIATRIMPEQIFNYAHNNSWLVENLGFVGRVREAVDLAKNMIELPRLAPKPPLPGESYASGRGGYAMGRERLLETAVRFELWPDLLALEGTPYLAPDEQPQREAERLLALGRACYAEGLAPKGDEKLAALEEEIRKLKGMRLTAADEAEAKAHDEKKSESDIGSAMAHALQGFSSRLEGAQAALAELRIYQSLAQKRPGEEVCAALKLVPSIPPIRLARFQLALGDLPAAEKAARSAVQKGEGDILPLALLADVLWQMGQAPAALETFQQVRALSAQADLLTPPLARLAPLARAAGLPEDWRLPLEWKPDAGVRPPLASLGPFRWHPYPAPAWSLVDQNGQRVSLSDFRGQPVLVVFYLGSGCARCIEQLNLFAPLTQAFRAAGISLVAVSVDSPDALHETFAKAAAGQQFTFPVLADPTLEAFKAYRAFDDFENIPLHGTFLVDGQGLVRWQDISFEAFQNPQWLLTEAKRLLSLPNWNDLKATASNPP